MLLTALKKCFQILEKVFPYDVESDTATQATIVDVVLLFFFPHGCFFLCPFVFSRKVCEVMHPKKGHVYVHFSPTSIRYSMFLVFKYLFLPS